MEQQRSHASSYNPKLIIDCVLANTRKKLEADGCVLDISNTKQQLTTPDQLAPGDFVKVRLWLEDEEPFIDIRLAEISKINKNWVVVEMISVNQRDRIRLKRLSDSIENDYKDHPAIDNYLFIRA
ncbi:hypothetical protein [Petrachloros mirabilis]